MSNPIKAKLEDFMTAARSTRDKAREEAQSMIRALRRKLDDTEKLLDRRDGSATFTHQDAGVEEALTLAYRLSTLSSADHATRAGLDLEDAVQAMPAAPSKPAKAQAPKATGEGEEKTDLSIELPDVDAPVEKSKGAKK